MAMSKRWAVVPVAIVAATLLTACEPEVFAFVVIDTTDAVDANPGDGICEATSGMGNCTLRAAIVEANAIGAKGSVELAEAAAYTISLAGAGEDGAETGDLDLTGRVRVVGNGSVIDGDGLDRVFDLKGGSLLELSDATVTGGSAATGGGFSLQSGGVLTLERVEVRENSADQGGAVFSAGSVSINNSTVADNVSTVGAGGVHATGGASTSVFNSTVSSNVGSAGGAGNIDNAGSLQLAFATVTAGGSSDAAQAGNIANHGSLTTYASVVADQSLGLNCVGAGAVTSGGYNLESATDCGFSGTGDQQGVAAALGALGDHGGTTSTHLPLDASPVIDVIPQGTPLLCEVNTPADQRGLARPMGSTCDIGAVEDISRPTSLDVSVHLAGLKRPWDLGFAPDGTMIYTEKNDLSFSAYVGGVPQLLARPADAVLSGESGMMGMAVDPEFVTNRRVYTCFLSNISGVLDIRVARWTVDPTYTAATDRVDIVTGLPVRELTSIGRHGGCRPRFGPDGYLWITTGDAATGTTPQDPASLGGKVLRVDRDGNGAPGNNPGPPFLPQIYTYGHRNVQGIAFRPSDGAAFSVEHGSTRDDEVNRLFAGANYGRDPIGGGGGIYNDSAPMTDLVKFPDAIEAVWSSGFPTIAPSGATFITGSQWAGWDGALVMAVLKDKHLRVLRLDPETDAILSEHVALFDTYGRLRSAVMGPDGNLYIAQDSGPGSIYKVVPTP